MATSHGPAGSSSGFDFMANLAAQLLGARPEARPVIYSAESPRTIPIAPPTSVPQPSPPVKAPLTASNPANSSSVAKENTPPTPQFIFSANPTTTSPQAPSALSPNLAMAEPDRGPSLFGNAEQLKAAREFAQSATKGGQKDRRGRDRLLSKEGSYGSRGSRSPLGSGGFGGFASSSRTPVNRPSPSSPVGAVPPSPSNSTSSTFTTRRSEISAPAATGSAALHGRPTAAPSNSAWTNFAANPIKKEDEMVKDTVKTFAKMEVSGTAAPTTSNTPQGTATPAHKKHMTDVHNILHDRAKDGHTPPHLCTKSTASTSNGTSTANGAMENVKPAVDRVKITTPAPSAGIAEPATPAVEHKPGPSATTAERATPAVEHKSSSVEAVEKKQKEPVVDISGGSNGLTNGTHRAGKAMETSTTNVPTINFVTLDQVKQLLVDVNARIKELENENLALHKQLEEVLQREEGRKFLGTDSAKVPFFINVMTHRHKIISGIQVNNALTIGALIRRIRVKANLTTASTRNPYISLNGTKFGHLMTLGEVGVAKDKEFKNLVFGFDDTEA